MSDIKLLCAFALIFIAISALGYSSYSILVAYPALVPVLLIQSMNTLACYLLLGLGIGLPIILLATALGWFQLVLLVSGNIDPHLAKAGFFNVLDTLFSKI